MKAIGYRYLLGTIMLSFLIIILIPSQLVGGPLRIAILGWLLQLALHTRRRAGRLTWPARILAGALLVATIVAAATGSARILAAITQAATIVLVAASIAVLSNTLMASKVVDGSVVRGVLSIYLLLALLFAAIHEFGATVTTHYLHGVDAATPSDTLYFSVITITTVGFGDITPGNALAQAVSPTEALVGQLYLVSVVAVVVSRYRSGSKPDQTPSS